MNSDGVDCGARARRSLERIQDLLNRDGRVAWAGLRPSDSRAVATGIRPPHSGCRKNVGFALHDPDRHESTKNSAGESPKTHFVIQNTGKPWKTRFLTQSARALSVWSSDTPPRLAAPSHGAEESTSRFPSPLWTSRHRGFGTAGA